MRKVVTCPRGHIRLILYYFQPLFILTISLNCWVIFENIYHVGCYSQQFVTSVKASMTLTLTWWRLSHIYHYQISVTVSQVTFLNWFPSCYTIVIKSLLCGGNLIYMKTFSFLNWCKRFTDIWLQHKHSISHSVRLSLSFFSLFPTLHVC